MSNSESSSESSSVSSSESSSKSNGASSSESSESGQPLFNSPNSGSLGSISAGALEDSNVDLSAELVALIIAQRNFQANSRTIETNSELQQTIINLR